MQAIIQQAQEAFRELSGNSKLTQDEMLAELGSRIVDKLQPQLPVGASLEVSCFVVDQPLIEPWKWGCKIETSFPLAIREEDLNV